MRLTLHGAEETFPGGAREIAPNTWAWLQPNGGWGESNAGLIRGEGASALIDTLWDRELTRRMLREFAPHFVGAPLRHAVNTHSDGDHWWGNVELPDEVEILTSKASLETMHEEAGPTALARQRQLAGLTARLPGWIPGGLGPMGQYTSEMLKPFDFEGIGKPRFPDRAFSGREALVVGGREVQLIEVGPAHTKGDLIAYVPDAGVVFAADILFVDVTPVMWAGPVANWLRALEVLLSLDAEIYIPGHGRPAGRAEVQQLHDYLHWLQQGVADQHSSGASSVEAVLALTRDPEFDRWRHWLCPERIVITATAEHRSLSGRGAIPATVVNRIRLFSQVAEAQRQLAGRI